MTIVLAVIFGLLGMALGSFLNVCIDRLPAGKSLVSPPSHCDGCGRKLSTADLFPVISYLVLRGRCRYCGARIPVRVPLVEAGSGILLAFLFWEFGLTFTFAVTGFFSLVLLLDAVIDLEQRLILNIITYPVALIALLVGYYGPSWQLLFFSGYCLLLLFVATLKPRDKVTVQVVVWAGLATVLLIEVLMPGHGDFNVLIGGAIGLGILMIPAIVTRSGMGMGDVKMAGMIGLMVGFPLVFVAILGGIILGGLTAIILVLVKRKGLKDMVPFGPFLSLGALVTFLYGQQILNWYLKLF